MMKTCTSCGAETAPEARFCRKCGAPLRATGPHGDPEQVSPQAATIPLRDVGRTTDGLPDETPRGGAQETARVSRAELDSILQQAARSTEFDPNRTATQSPGNETIADIPRPQAGTQGGAQTSGFTPSQTTGGQRPISDEDLLKTRLDMSGRLDNDEELTVASSRPFTGEVRPQPVQPVLTTGPLDGPSPAQQQTHTAGQQYLPTPPPAAPKKKSNLWLIVAVVCVVMLGLAAVGGWFAISYLRKPATVAPTVEPTAPTATADEKQRAEEKLVEAESLLASGDLNGALERLREAVRLDPQNARAHRRLGDILIETGARREGIEELRQVTRLEPNDFTAWRSLAAAQLAEGLPADAVESYRRLISLTGDTDPHDSLALADALRLAGRADEARAIYQKLLTSQVADVSTQARQHLAALASTQPTPTPQPTRDPRTQGQTTDTTTQVAEVTQPTPQPAPTAAPTPQPTPPPAQTQLTPEERYRRGVELWGSNRGAAVTEFLAAARSGVADANYYLGLNLVEGRNLSSLKRAEVVAALGYFQRAQSGRHGAQARNYVRQLEAEYDRIRSQKQ